MDGVSTNAEFGYKRMVSSALIDLIHFKHSINYCIMGLIEKIKNKNKIKTQ